MKGFAELVVCHQEICDLVSGLLDKFQRPEIFVTPHLAWSRTCLCHETYVYGCFHSRRYTRLERGRNTGRVEGRVHGCESREATFAFESRVGLGSLLSNEDGGSYAAD